MKSVLLLTNFSETSRNAISGYLKVYLKHVGEKYKFILLNVYSQPKTGQSQMVRFDDILEKFSLEDLNAEYNYFKELPGAEKLNMELSSQKGDLVDAIEHISTKQSIDLIVMGTKGSNLLRELLLGSETDRLVRLSKNPVLVIPESIEFTKPERIVFATSIKECKNKEEFKKLTGIIRSFNAEFMILNVYKDDKPPVAYFEERIKNELKGMAYSFHYVQNDDIAEGITDFMQQNNVELLSLIDRKINLLSKLFRHRVTSKLISNAEVPLLIIHE